MPELTIKGLSLTRPWPFAFLNGPLEHQKRVENRTWQPPSDLIGHFIALHAAKSWDEDDRRYIARCCGMPVPDKAGSPHSEIFAICKLTGFVTEQSDPRLPVEQWKWFSGPYGWLLDEVVPLIHPVRCSGEQGLWGFERRQDILRLLRKSYRESIGRSEV